MKNVFMMRKKKDAVSPVIATILMVAITVVLAAVLYVMVMGYGSGGGTSAPAASLAKQTSTSGVTVVITISPSADASKIGVKFGNNNTICALNSVPVSTAYTLSLTNTGKVTTGDTIAFSTTQMTATTSIQLVWMPSGINGSDKQLIGNVLTF